MAFLEITPNEAREKLRLALAVHFRLSDAHDPMVCADATCIPCRAVIYLTIIDAERKARAEMVDALALAAMPVRPGEN